MHSVSLVAAMNLTYKENTNNIIIIIEFFHNTKIWMHIINCFVNCWPKQIQRNMKILYIHVLQSMKNKNKRATSPKR